MQMKVRPGLALLTLVLLLASCSPVVEWGRYANTLGSLSADQWAGDVAALREGLESGHPDLFHAGRRAEFEAAASSLLQSLQVQADGERRADSAVAGIAKMLATIGEGHTALNSSPLSYYPFVLRWFSTGSAVRELRVVRAQATYRQALGSTVVSIGGHPVPEAEAMIDAYLSVDHSNGYPTGELSALTNPRLLRGIGLADESGVTYELRNEQGSLSTLTVAEVPSTALSLVDVRDEHPAVRELPFLHTSERRWYEVSGSVMYLQYNSCDLDAFGFFQGVVERLREGNIDRLIVDLRGNGGGSSPPGTWFARALSGIPAINRRGGLYVLVGPGTFSSAEMMAADLMDRTKALFAGQPLAEPVDGWGEVARFVLPGSGLVIGHSTRFFNYSAGKSLRTVDGIIVPDPGLERQSTFDEWIAGRDPVYELALNGAGR